MDVVALGELLIDFTENGVSSQSNPLFEAKQRRKPLQSQRMQEHWFRLTRILGSRSGIRWRKRRSRCCMVWDNATS